MHMKCFASHFSNTNQNVGVQVRRHSAEQPINHPRTEPMLAPLSITNTPFTESRSEAYQHPCTDPWLPIVPNCCMPQQPGHLLHPGTASSCAREKGQLASSGYTETKRCLWSGAGGTATGFLSMDSSPRTARKSATFMFCNKAANPCLPFLWINQVMFSTGGSEDTTLHFECFLHAHMLPSTEGISVTASSPSD